MRRVLVITHGTGIRRGDGELAPVLHYSPDLIKKLNGQPGLDVFNQMAGYDAYATFSRERPGKDLKVMNNVNAWQFALVYPDEARIALFAATEIEHNAALLFE